MSYSKKGLSAVVATVLLILLTVIAATVIGAFLVPFVQENLKKSTECVKYDTYFTFDEEFELNCYRITRASDGKEASIDTHLSLRAKNDKELGKEIGGLSVVLYVSADPAVQLADPGDKRIVTLKVDTQGSSSLKQYGLLGEAKVPGAGDVASYTFSQSTVGATLGVRYARAEVYPILKSGRVCEKPSGQTKLIACKA